MSMGDGEDPVQWPTPIGDIPITGQMTHTTDAGCDLDETLKGFSTTLLQYG